MVSPSTHIPLELVVRKKKTIRASTQQAVRVVIVVAVVSRNINLIIYIFIRQWRHTSHSLDREQIKKLRESEVSDSSSGLLWNSSSQIGIIRFLVRNTMNTSSRIGIIRFLAWDSYTWKPPKKKTYKKIKSIIRVWWYFHSSALQPPQKLLFPLTRPDPETPEPCPGLWSRPPPLVVTRSTTSPPLSPLSSRL